MKNIFRFFSFSISIVLIFSSMFVLKADDDFSSCEDLVLLKKALMGQIEYDVDWFDVNFDNSLNALDLIRAKKHFAGKNVDYKPVFYIVLTFTVNNNVTTKISYSKQNCLPNLNSPYRFWRTTKGNEKEYFSPNSFMIIRENTSFLAVKSNPNVDFPAVGV